jgi:Holliday junction DNA helicase RuvA
VYKRQVLEFEQQALGGLLADAGNLHQAAVLSGLSVSELAQAVAMQEAGRLVKIPGIGKKTAERLLLELKDKLPKSTLTAAAATAAPDAGSDILNALLALGYNEREALGAMKTLPAGVAVSDGIRQALKALSKN